MDLPTDGLPPAAAGTDPRALGGSPRRSHRAGVVARNDIYWAERGLPEMCVISCDSVITVPITELDPEPVDQLGEVKWVELDRALRYALDIVS